MQMAALLSIFDHLMENNSVSKSNPVHGVKRSWVEINWGKTPVFSDDHAKLLLTVPNGWTFATAQ
jgi:hypothetical protein